MSAVRTNAAPRGPRMTEAQLHRAVAGYLTLWLAPPAWFTTFPAGGGGELRGKILKGMSLKAGVPDLLVVHRGHAFWIELKTDSGRLSESQHWAIAALRRADCPVAVCRSLDEARAAVAAWGLPTREVPATTQRMRDALAAATKDAAMVTLKGDLF